MSFGLHSSAAVSHEPQTARSSSSRFVTSKLFLLGVAFAVLHVAVAWVAFSSPTSGIGPAPVSATQPVEDASAAYTGAEGMAAASSSVSAAIDLLYAELPLRMSDGEWRRDMTTSCMLLSTRAGELDALLPAEAGYAQLRGVLLDMSETADELRVAVQVEDAEAARLALERMENSVAAWGASASQIGAQ